MNEEIKNEVEEAICVDQIEGNSKGIGKFVIGGVAIVAAGIGAWLYKKHKKDKNNDDSDPNVVDGKFTVVEGEVDDSEKE